MTDDWTWTGKVFQTIAAATANERSQLISCLNSTVIPIVFAAFVAVGDKDRSNSSTTESPGRSRRTLALQGI